eukprot:TRINITY_DN1112_c1_g1_i1.p1 TRINITY_DN1112_c1_g1~~TRINITY_DN1112_c1_g1_i1.p1  ORF type:complete len:637 (+),score=162.87 TRINITY_DN1112_c1_g1_i1:55-1911(+)
MMEVGDDYSLPSTSPSSSRVGRLLLALFLLLTILAIAAVPAYILIDHFHDPTTTTSTTTTPPTTTPSPPTPTPGSTGGGAPNASVASANTLCSEEALRVMKEGGGNAVDGGVVVALCLDVINTFATSLGGGGGMNIYLSDSATSTFIDFREMAPQSASQDMYVDSPKDSQIGARSIAIPGELKGLEMAFNTYGSGKVSWSDVVEPALRLARDGFPVSAPLAQRVKKFCTTLTNDPVASKIFLNEAGECVVEGEVIRKELLASTLEVVSREGSIAFYDGSLTDLVVKEINDAGGDFVREDLVQFVAIERTPLTGYFRGHKILAPPPPYGGACVLQLLNTLGYFPTPNLLDAEAIHRFAESAKFAYSNRMSLGDPSFVELGEVLETMLSLDHAGELFAKIKNISQDPAAYEDIAPLQPLDDHGTSHFSIVDADRNAVAMTHTVNLHFGSKVWGPLTGIVYNDQMDDFSTPGQTNAFGLKPSVANFIAPGKRPLSSMSPTILLKDDQVKLVVGGSGGSRIITAVAQVIVKVLELKMNVTEAVNSNRYHHQWSPDVLNVEKGTPQSIIDDLIVRGQNVQVGIAGANIQAVHVLDDGTLEGVSDKRKHGEVANYKRWEEDEAE